MRQAKNTWSGADTEPRFPTGPRERHLETLVHNTLRSIILTQSIPRTLVQITLQVRILPEEDSTAGVNTVRFYSVLQPPEQYR